MAVKILLVGTLVLTLCSIALSKSVKIRSGQRADFDLLQVANENRPEFIKPKDLEASATGHGHHHGRVQIKVYRGPSDGHHAPHGFWVKQPADHHHY